MSSCCFAALSLPGPYFSEKASRTLYKMGWGTMGVHLNVESTTNIQFFYILQQKLGHFSTSTTGKDFLHLQQHLVKIYNNKTLFKNSLFGFFGYIWGMGVWEGVWVIPKMMTSFRLKLNCWSGGILHIRNG